MKPSGASGHHPNTLPPRQCPSTPARSALQRRLPAHSPNAGDELLCLAPEPAIEVAADALIQAIERGFDGRWLACLARLRHLATATERPDCALEAYGRILPALAAAPADAERWAPTLRLLQCECLALVGDVPTAMANAQEVTLAAIPPKDPMLKCVSHQVLAAIQACDGDLTSARSHAEQAVQALSENLITPRLLRDIYRRRQMWSLQKHEAPLRGTDAETFQQWMRAHAISPPAESMPLDEALDLCAIAEALIDTPSTPAHANAAAWLLRQSRRCSAEEVTSRAWLQMARLRRARGQGRHALQNTARALQGEHHCQPRTLQNAYQLLADLLGETEQQPEQQPAQHDACALAHAWQLEVLRRSIAVRVKVLALLPASPVQEADGIDASAPIRAPNMLVLSHEISQPLASMKLLVETAIAQIQSGTRKELNSNVAAINQLGHRLSVLTTQLCQTHGQEPPCPEPIDLRKAAAEALTILRARLAHTPCVIRQRLPRVKVWAIEDHLVRVLVNLIRNAIDAMETQADRRIEISADLQQTGTVRIWVADSGPGIAKERLESVFQPFYTTKSHDLGMGLGLALSRDMVRLMEGELVATSPVAHGAVFCISLRSAS
ncbi:MAG: sensor histidine kinase [Hydrogenophaga sp.]